MSANFLPLNDKKFCNFLVVRRRRSGASGVPVGNHAGSVSFLLSQDSRRPFLSGRRSNPVLSAAPISAGALEGRSRTDFLSERLGSLGFFPLGFLLAASRYAHVVFLGVVRDTLILFFPLRLVPIGLSA